MQGTLLHAYGPYILTMAMSPSLLYGPSSCKSNDPCQLQTSLPHGLHQGGPTLTWTTLPLTITLAPTLPPCPDAAARTPPRQTNPYTDCPSPHHNPSPNPAPPCPDAAARTPPRQSATRRRRGRPSCWTGRCCRPRCGGVWCVRCVRWYAVVCGVWWWVVYNDVWCAVWCVLTHAPCLLTHMSLHGAVWCGMGGVTHPSTCVLSPFWPAGEQWAQQLQGSSLCDSSPRCPPPSHCLMVRRERMAP